MTREEIESYIRENASSYFERDKSGKGYICPICGSGSGRKGTGITENPKSKGHFTCWVGCFKNASIFDIIAIQYNIPATDFNAVFNKACELFGVAPDTPAPVRQPAKSNKPATAQESTDTANFKEFYEESRKHLEETDYHRGISLETLKAYSVGYIPEWRHPKAPNALLTPRLIIPINNEGYLARDTRKNISENEKQYEKLHAGTLGIWNAKAIAKAETPLYVVEGEIDGLSIIDAGSMAVALCSVVNAKKFIERVKETPPKFGFIISLDTDKAGKEATAIITEGLAENGIPFCVHGLPSQYKDANEFFTANRTGFAEWVNQGVSAFREKIRDDESQAREEFENESVYSDLGNFLHTLKISREGKCIPTGFTQLDNLLDGGLYPGLYFIGALSSLGKTAFTLQMADNIASSGRGVLFFSLEMSRNELIARSLSRLTRLHCGDSPKLAKTTRGILRADFNTQERGIFEKAVAEYSGYASNLFISEGVGDIGVDAIKKKLDRFIHFNEGIPPVIIIDYAQILAPADKYATDKQNVDKNILELKRTSRDYQIPIFAISSFNRENYLEPVNMTSFKESGAVEYTSDVLIGLQYAGWDYQEKEKESEHKRRVREKLDVIKALARQGMPINIELKVLKHRNGAIDRINYRFHPMFNLFEEAE